MDKGYKIERELLSGECEVKWYDDPASAKRVMTRLRKERILKTRWAELFETDFDEENGDWKLVAGFEREVAEVMGYEIATGRVIDY